MGLRIRCVQIQHKVSVYPVSSLTVPLQDLAGFTDTGRGTSLILLPVCSYSYSGQASYQAVPVFSSEKRLFLLCVDADIKEQANLFFTPQLI